MPNDTRKAFASLSRLIKTWEELAAQYPDVVEFRSDLSATYFMQSYLIGNLSQRTLAAGILKKAQMLSEGLVREFPNVPEHRADLARIDHELAVNLLNTASAKEVDVLFQRSLELREELVRELPTNAQHRNDLAQSLALWGLRHGGEPQRAEATFRRSIEICRKLRDDFPRVSSWGAFDVGDAYRILSLTCAKRPGGFKEAEELHREEIAHWEALAAENPLDPMRCVGAQAECHRQWGRMLAAAGKREAAEDSFAAADAAYCRALDRAQKAVEENSGSPDIRHRLEIGIGPLLCFAVENPPSKALLASLKRVGLAYPNRDLEFQIAALLAALGDRADYLTYCDDLLSRYSGTKEPAVAERTAKACSTVEPTASNLTRIAKLSQRAVELGAGNWIAAYANVSRGLVAYRQGDYAAAIGFCGPKQVGRGAGDWFLHAEAELVVAMASQKLGRTSEAASSLEAARHLIATSSAGVFDGRLDGPKDLAICQALEREAEALVKGAVPTKASEPSERIDASGGHSLGSH